MADRVIVDTGPLVAIYSRDDGEHGRCVEALRTIRPPLLTSWPVITEVAWFLRNASDAMQKLFADINDCRITIQSIDDREATAAIPTILARYRDLPCQLADASLLYLADREGVNTIFTLDRRDFTVYRLANNRPATIIPD